MNKKTKTIIWIIIGVLTLGVLGILLSNVMMKAESIAFSKFLDLLKQKVSENDYNFASTVYDNIRSKYVGDSLNSDTFASCIANAILDNRLDINSIVVGLVYPIYIYTIFNLNSFFLNS